MDWSLLSNNYFGSYWVRRDGHIVFHEKFEKIEYVCNKCGSTSALLGVEGTPKVFSELANLKPMQRILKALEYVDNGTLALLDNISPSEVMEYVECFRDRWLMKHKRGREAVEEFVERAKCIVGRWKLLEEP